MVVLTPLILDSVKWLNIGHYIDRPQYVIMDGDTPWLRGNIFQEGEEEVSFTLGVSEFCNKKWLVQFCKTILYLFKDKNIIGWVDKTNKNSYLFAKRFRFKEEYGSIVGNHVKMLKEKE